MELTFFETADSQNQRGKQRFAAVQSASNRREAERKAGQLGRDRFKSDFTLETEPLPGNPLMTRFVVVCGSERVAVESPTWW